MGAQVFEVEGKGETVEEAFREVVKNARYEYGHRGYTGSIAEKSEFVVIKLPEDIKTDWMKIEYANILIDCRDPRIADKWGPAGAIKLSGDRWFFFGWASS